MDRSSDDSHDPNLQLDLASSSITSADGQEEYVQLQLRIYRMFLLVTAFAVFLSSIFFDSQFTLSLLLGAVSGLLYLRLLARGIGRLGKTSRAVSKVQLLVPITLVLVASKLPELALLPALIGFLLFKPSLIIQFLLEPKAKVASD